MITVIYYTSNTENPDFENRIQKTLLENKGDFPLISVSQKPLSLGENICVGDVGRSSFNQWRQVQIGLKFAKTKYVALAESDFLYPKEHFLFLPTEEDVFYVPFTVYQLCTMKNKIHKFILMHQRFREGTSIVSKNYLLKALDEILGDTDFWKPGIEKPRDMPRYLFEGKNVKVYKNRIPLVTFRTDQGMHQHIHDDHPSGLDQISFWGKADELMRVYCA
jgi:hypothetical protein